MTENNNNLGRRKYLHAITGASSLLLAGCSSSSTTPTTGQEPDKSETETTTASASNPIKDVFVEDAKLKVELASENDAEKLNVIDPNGTEFKSKSLAAGVTSVSFNLVRGYVPGEQKVIAAAGGEALQTETISIEPQLEVLEISVAKNNPDLDWDKDDRTWKYGAGVEVKNTGSGPITVTNLHFMNTPNPTPANDENLRDHGQVTLNPGAKTILYSARRPFIGVVDGHIKCGSEAKGKVSLTTTAGDDVMESFSWSSSGDYEYIHVEGCSISVERE